MALNDKQIVRIISAMSEFIQYKDKRIDEIMLENEYLAKDRDYYKGLYDAHRARMDEGE